jgi:XisI protein
MDRVNQYRQAIQTFLHDYVTSRLAQSGQDTKIEAIFDTDNDRYLVLDIGWDGSRRIHNCIFHFDIKDGKIWIQENNTDIEVDEELEAMGITKTELVIGFHHPSMREYSDYAVA